MSQDTTAVRNDAFTRASALANRARELRRAQSEVQELTSREVQVLARTAASFFDSLPLVEFTTTLLPQSARGLRRIRHRVLHRTIHHTETGTLIRALLLGRDGGLRLFSARSADSRDLLLILEPGRTLPVGVMRDVVDWTPTLYVPGFRPFEILDKLSHSLDAVEEQIGEAEQRVQVQKAALASGDLSALLPAPPDVAALPAREAPRVLSAGPTVVSASVAAPIAATSAVSSASVVVPDDPFTIFDRVEAVAEGVQSLPAPRPAAPVASSPAVPSVLPPVAPEEEPDEWDEPVEAPSATSLKRAQSTDKSGARAHFPVMPSAR